MSKVIGVTGPSAYSPEVNTMIEVFGMPLYINQNEPTHLDWLLDRIDGLVLAGGSDIYPITYGQEITNGFGFSKFDLRRDKREIYLINGCIKRGIKILGICRGHQLLGLFHKLHFIKNISNSDVCHNPKSSGIETEQRGQDDLPVHFLNVFPNFREQFPDRLMVNSFHHQAVSYHSNFDYKGSGVVPMGVSCIDYKNGKQDATFNIELMRGVDNNWLSCQWHPELDYESNVASERVINTFFKEMVKV